MTPQKEPRRVASVAPFNADGLLLFGKRNDSGKWTLPGGKLEAGEDPMDGAKRELQEEAGLQGQDLVYLGRGMGGPKGDIVVYCYRAIVEGDPDASQDPDHEMSDWKWVEPDDIPAEIADNLHAQKNVTLRLLGLQDGEVEAPLEKKADPHFVEQRPQSGTAIRIPKLGTKTRKRWDQDYLQGIAQAYTGGDITRLRYIQVPTERVFGGNMAVNKSRLALYKRMLKARDRLPPAVVRRSGTSSAYDLLDGNHRQQAHVELGVPMMHAVEILEPIRKNLPGLAMAATMVAGGAMPQQPAPQPQFHQQAQALGVPTWTPEGLTPEMYPIAHLESSWGQNLAHASHSKGAFHTAFGALGFKPITAHDEYMKSPFAQDKYPGLNNPEAFLQHFQADSKFYNLLASAHFRRLKQRHGGVQQAAYAWRWGSGAATQATPEQIKNDAYVQKFTDMKLDQLGHIVNAPLAKADKLPLEEKLIAAIEPHLTDDLRRAPWKGHPNCLAGHCYVASEALYHLLGGQASGYVPQSIQHAGGPHWYLKHKETGKILDPTASQFTDTVPYSQGVGKGFLTKLPSKRAQQVIDAVRLGKADTTETPEFKNWFQGSKVLDDNDQPRRVYHGTTHDFKSFSDKHGNPENFLGRGHYFTDSPEDVGANYATEEGPDLKQRIEQHADRLGWEDQPDREAAHEQAKALLTGPAARTIPAYLHMKNPVHLRNGGGTRYDEETAPKIHRAIERAVKDYQQYDQGLTSDAIHSYFSEAGMDPYYFTAQELMDNIKDNPRLMDLTDHQGNLINTEFIRDVFRHAGHDGAIMDASRFRNMKGTQGANHYIVWNPRQIKGAFNTTFNPRSTDFGKSEHDIDPLDAMLHHDDPRERMMALRSKLVTPYHLRTAMRDEDPDVREMAIKHPMMTSALIEEALRDPDVFTREAALDRPDLQDHHLEMALWDPDLQTKAALHPALTEEQRAKILADQRSPEGLKTELMAKSIGYVQYPQLDDARTPGGPMMRSPRAHNKFMGVVMPNVKEQVRGKAKIHGAVQYNSYADKELPPDQRILRASIGMSPNTPMAMVHHETQHAVYASLKQKYGREGSARIIDATMKALDPKDLEHLKRITDYTAGKYSPSAQSEERIAYLQNYLQDGLWRRSAHKHMRIHMDANAQKISHDWAKVIWKKLRQAAEALTPQQVGVIRKDEELIGNWIARKSEPDVGYNVYEDMLGLTPKTEAYLEAAKFLGHTEPDRAVFRQAMLEDFSLLDAALISVGMHVNEENQKALAGVLQLQRNGELEKAESTHEVIALMADGGEVAEGVRRGFGANTEQTLHLGGKHSKGSLMVRDPESGQTYLLKPGSGGQSPAAGAKEERANQSRREAAFWHVAETWGLDQRLPRADLLLIDGKEVAVLHMLPFDWKNLEKLRYKDAGLPHKALEKYRQMGELHKWAILDYVLGNPDRHGQNLMVGTQKEGYPVALIDHGSAFAGNEFDPANDKNSFIPYYLRAWRADSWGSMTSDEKLRAMPTVSGDTEKQLREWFHGINASDLEAVLHRYGIDPQPSIARLAKVKLLLAEESFSEAINRIWLAT